MPSRTFVSTVLLGADGYESKQMAELKSLLRHRGLPATGRKADLVQRLKQNDMARAGSTLTQAPEKGKKGKGTRQSKELRRGKDAADHAAAETPPAPLEPGSVSSPTKDRDGNLGQSSPSPSEPAPSNAPGMPEHKAEPVPETFNIIVPYEKDPPAPAQYIPSIAAYANPFQDFSDSYKQDWHMAQTPRVHALGDYHIAVNDNSGHLAPLPSQRSNVVMDLASDFLPIPLFRRTRNTVEQMQDSMRGAAASIGDELKRALPLEARAINASNARPSARRPLNEGERTGLAVVGAIVATGLFLSYVVESSDMRREHKSDAYTPSSYSTGAGIVGAGWRKV
ncbi:hypothetical protein MVES1_002299 [Malassezia vespertilionis]|uniref:SAP domain-containing protein n=1 Tax=Malassezia vespertilionis TaxID=2020962 RepID=A0A2N1JBD5_9BASI|nr:uncharacterized protein MVES1_002299 [Malassezia vespertilionis]PKI83853.1 hypothetical protein MVES_002166 [Malassezia vespertilionis]WFD06944.1 hypothetical protein MVES1_002299 [Malassezia vespertilionis]